MQMVEDNLQESVLPFLHVHSEGSNSNREAWQQGPLLMESSLGPSLTIKEEVLP